MDDLLADEAVQKAWSREGIEFYRIGMRVTTREMVDDIRSPNSKGISYQADENARRNPIVSQLGQLHENLGNGLMRVYQGMKRDISLK
ncbi:hypothetical protein HYY69_07230 [Candidatus Woesearchaeota archaeon]|nr:hypothetical protein [Candidatus Woesearchaeota archaeon]